jgi:hypothetical protein
VKRRLSLTRESLTELTPDDLGAVAGGGMEETTLCNVVRVTHQLTWAIRTAVETITCWC